MKSPAIASGAEQKVAPVYIVLERETMIDAPVKTVWRHALNYPSWQNYSIVQHVSGERGEEGEVVLLKKEETSAPTTAYYARTIKIEPERRVIWKTFRENVNYFGIVEFRFHDVNGTTRFCNNSLYEHNVPYRDEAEIEAFRRQAYANMEELLASILPKLKAVAERDAQR
jgi:hypothetical protein